jgi:hypothetical protein
MIKQLEHSESVGVPRDQKTAHAVLRLLGAFEAGTALRPGTADERRADADRAGAYLGGTERKIVTSLEADDADRDR